MYMRAFGKRMVTWVLYWSTKVVLWRFHPVVIGIAGSTNKTTVKRALQSLLPDTKAVRINPASYNTEIGLPLAVLGLSGGGSLAPRWLFVSARAVLTALLSITFPRLLILELGVDRVGDMAYLLRMVRPRALVLTTVAAASSLSVDPEARVMRDELSLAVASLPKNGTLMVNCDDDVVRGFIEAAPCAVLTYGIRDDATIRIHAVEELRDGMKAILTDTRTGSTRALFLPLFGRHHLSAAAAAEAAYRVLKDWNIPTLQI